MSIVIRSVTSSDILYIFVVVMLVLTSVRKIGAVIFLAAITIAPHTMIVGGLHSRAECPTALHLLHSRNGHEAYFGRWPGVWHSVQYFGQQEFPVRCVLEPQ
jgi:hypothetical protein